MNGIEFCKKGEGRSKQEDCIQSGAHKLTVKGKGINISCTCIIYQVFEPLSKFISSNFIPTLQMRNLSFREVNLLAQIHRSSIKQSWNVNAAGLFPEP